MTLSANAESAVLCEKKFLELDIFTDIILSANAEMDDTVKIMKSDSLESRGAEAVAELLGSLEFDYAVQATPGNEAASGGDAAITIKIPGSGEWQLLVEGKHSGQPRILREGIQRLQLSLGARGERCYGVIVAPYITVAGAAICREAGVGFVDWAGNCLLRFGPVLVERTGRENPMHEARELRKLFSPKASRILRVLLLWPGRAWKTEALAAEADISFGHVSNVRKALREREWIDESRKGLRLTAPLELLAAWAKEYDPARNERLSCYVRGGVEQIESRLADLADPPKGRFALTGLAAASRLAPYARYGSVSLYASGCADRVKAALNASPAETGPNLLLWTPYDVGVFYGLRRMGGVPIVSAVQTYLDLRGAGGRQEAAAEVLLDREIAPRWRSVTKI